MISQPQKGSAESSIISYSEVSLSQNTKEQNTPALYNKASYKKTKHKQKKQSFQALCSQNMHAFKKNKQNIQYINFPSGREIVKSSSKEDLQNTKAVLDYNLKALAKQNQSYTNSYEYVIKNLKCIVESLMSKNEFLRKDRTEILRENISLKQDKKSMINYVESLREKNAELMFSSSMGGLVDGLYQNRDIFMCQSEWVVTRKDSSYSGQGTEEKSSIERDSKNSRKFMGEEDRSSPNTPFYRDELNLRGDQSSKFENIQNRIINGSNLNTFRDSNEEANQIYRSGSGKTSEKEHVISPQSESSALQNNQQPESKFSSNAISEISSPQFARQGHQCYSKKLSNPHQWESQPYSRKFLSSSDQSEDDRNQSKLIQTHSGRENADKKENESELYLPENHSQKYLIKNSSEEIDLHLDILKNYPNKQSVGLDSQDGKQSNDANIGYEGKWNSQSMQEVNVRCLASCPEGAFRAFYLSLLQFPQMRQKLLEEINCLRSNEQFVLCELYPNNGFMANLLCEFLEAIENYNSWENFGIIQHINKHKLLDILLVQCLKSTVAYLFGSLKGISDEPMTEAERGVDSRYKNGSEGEVGCQTQRQREQNCLEISKPSINDLSTTDPIQILNALGEHFDLQMIQQGGVIEFYQLGSADQRFDRSAEVSSEPKGEKCQILEQSDYIEQGRQFGSASLCSESESHSQNDLMKNDGSIQEPYSQEQKREQNDQGESQEREGESLPLFRILVEKHEVFLGQEQQINISKNQSFAAKSSVRSSSDATYEFVVKMSVIPNVYSNSESNYEDRSANHYPNYGRNIYEQSAQQIESSVKKQFQNISIRSHSSQNEFEASASSCSGAEKVFVDEESFGVNTRNNTRLIQAAVRNPNEFKVARSGHGSHRQQMGEEMSASNSLSANPIQTQYWSRTQGNSYRSRFQEEGEGEKPEKFNQKLHSSRESQQLQSHEQPIRQMHEEQHLLLSSQSSEQQSRSINAQNLRKFDFQGRQLRERQVTNIPNANQVPINNDRNCKMSSQYCYFQKFDEEYVIEQEDQNSSCYASKNASRNVSKQTSLKQIGYGQHHGGREDGQSEQAVKRLHKKSLRRKQSKRKPQGHQRQHRYEHSLEQQRPRRLEKINNYYGEEEFIDSVSNASSSPIGSQTSEEAPLAASAARRFRDFNEGTANVVNPSDLYLPLDQLANSLSTKGVHCKSRSRGLRG